MSPSVLVFIGPAVRPAIGNRQTDKHIAFHYVDMSIVAPTAFIIIIIIIMEKTEAGLRGLCIREIDVKSQIFGP